MSLGISAPTPLRTCTHIMYVYKRIPIFCTQHIYLPNNTTYLKDSVRGRPHRYGIGMAPILQPVLLVFRNTYIICVYYFSPLSVVVWRSHAKTRTHNPFVRVRQRITCAQFICLSRPSIPHGSYARNTDWRKFNEIFWLNL